jgi:hypothetical protein
MGESYRELFGDFLIEYNNGRRWWYLLDSNETDNSSSANLFGTTKQKLTDLMVGAKLAKSYDKRHQKFDSCPTKSKVSVKNIKSTVNSTTQGFTRIQLRGE